MLTQGPLITDGWNSLIRNKLVLRNHFPWPICHLLHKNKEHLALRNNFWVTKKFLIAKFDCTPITYKYRYIKKIFHRLRESISECSANIEVMKTWHILSCALPNATASHLTNPTFMSAAVYGMSDVYALWPILRNFTWKLWTPFLQ